MRKSGPGGEARRQRRRLGCECRGRNDLVVETDPLRIARVEKIVSKEAIIQAVASWGEELTPNAIEVYVSRLRAKLEPAGVKIRTVRGFGYMLEEFEEKKAGR